MNTVAKWRCDKCGKVFYTDGIGKEHEPVCHCSWDSPIKFLWVDFEPTKRVYDEVANSGHHLVKKFSTKKDAWIFSAHVLAKDEEDLRKKLDTLPF
jgi:hypothetical protein